MTITFMKELMQWYKDQKKLHRKCAYQVPPLPAACHSEPQSCLRLPCDLVQCPSRAGQVVPKTQT